MKGAILSAHKFRSLATSSPVGPDFIVKSTFSDIRNCAGITLPEHLASFEKPSWKTSVAFVSLFLPIFNILIIFIYIYIYIYTNYI